MAKNYRIKAEKVYKLNEGFKSCWICWYPINPNFFVMQNGRVYMFLLSMMSVFVSICLCCS